MHNIERITRPQHGARIRLMERNPEKALRLRARKLDRTAVPA